MPIKIYFCYAHEDEALLIKLLTHLKLLQQQGFIEEIWSDREIGLGADLEREIENH
jgi:hypothetical protein